MSRRSPAAACRLARTDRYTLKGAIHHASGVDGRDWEGGARFGALRERHRAYLYKNLAKIAIMKDTRILRGAVTGRCRLAVTVLSKID